MNRQTKRLWKENNELEKQILPENDAVLTDMVVYLRAANISLYRQEQIRRDVTQMLLDAQMRGESAAGVIGGDYQAFCDSVLAEVPHRSWKMRALSGAGDACLYVGVLAAIWLCTKLAGCLTGQTVWPLLTVMAGDLAGMLLILCVSVGVVLYVCKTGFRTGSAETWKAWAALTVLLALALAACVFWRAPLVRVHVYAAVGVVLGLFLLHVVLRGLAGREGD